MKFFGPLFFILIALGLLMNMAHTMPVWFLLIAFFFILAGGMLALFRGLAVLLLGQHAAGTMIGSLAADLVRALCQFLGRMIYRIVRGSSS